MSDTVFLYNISLNAVIGKDCWHRDKAQPVLISFRLFTNISLAGETDDVVNTINYGTVYKEIAKALTNATYPTLDGFTHAACRIALDAGGGQRVIGTVRLPKALLQAEAPEGGVSCEIEMQKGEEIIAKTLSVKNLRLPTLIGVNRHERLDKQLVEVNLTIYDAKTPEMTDYQETFHPVCQRVQDATYETLEALVISLARLLTSEIGYNKVSVSVGKPNAYGLVQYPGVKVTRSFSDFINQGEGNRAG